MCDFTNVVQYFVPNNSQTERYNYSIIIYANDPTIGERSFKITVCGINKKPSLLCCVIKSRRMSF